LGLGQLFGQQAHTEYRKETVMEEALLRLIEAAPKEIPRWFMPDIDVSDIQAPDIKRTQLTSEDNMKEFVKWLDIYHQFSYGDYLALPQGINFAVRCRLEEEHQMAMHYKKLDRVRDERRALLWPVEWAKGVMTQLDCPHPTIQEPRTNLPKSAFDPYDTIEQQDFIQKGK
jgi:hypothetical protein